MLVWLTCVATPIYYVLRETRDAEALHQLRVGLRRLHAAFATFKPILPGKELLKLGAEIKWMGGELDRARDLDVSIENDTHSRKIKNEDESRSRRLGDRLRAAQTAGYDRALAAVNSHRFAMLMLDCSEWVEIGSWRRSRDKEVVGLRDGVASELGCAALDRLSRNLRKAGKTHACPRPPSEASRQDQSKELALCRGILCGDLWSSFEGPPLEIHRLASKAAGCPGRPE